jgi:hypothetical protein
LSCVEFELESGWGRYIESLKNVDCEASLKRIIKKGPITKYIPSEFNDEKPVELFHVASLNKTFGSELNNLPSDEIISKLKESLDNLLDQIDNPTYDYMNKLNQIIIELNL